MVETQDLEVYAMEMELVTDSVMADLMQNNIENIVLLKQGIYVGIYSTDKHKVMTDKIIYPGGGMNAFEAARIFFAVHENRGERLALVDENGQILTFLMWNQRAEKDETYLKESKIKILELLKQGYEIIFENWDEYTAEYVYFLDGKGDFSNQVFLSGRNWELDDAYVRYQYTKDKDEKKIAVSKEGIFYPTEEKAVHSLMRMKEEYLYKSLYFYMDISSHICWFVAKFLCEYGFMPEGFCELQSQRETETFLGRTVEDLEQIVMRPESLIVIIDQTDMDALKKYAPEEKLVRYCDMFGFDTEMIGKRVFQTWGSKEWMLDLLKEMYFYNLCIPYRNYRDKNDVEGILLWEVMGNWDSEGYKEYMKQVNHNVELYSLRPLYETHWSTSTALFIRNFQEALDKGKNIILFGIKSHYTNLWLHILGMFGLSFEIMDEEEMDNWYGFRIESIHELPFYDRHNLLVVVNQPYAELPYAVEMLKAYGVSKEKHNCISIYEEIDRVDRGANMIDMCAGPLCELLAKQPIPGYVTIGEGRDTDYKILVVGGSTSDSTLFRYRSWPEELYNILKRQEKHTTIYSGGMAGAVSAQELSKLMRDIGELKPDMVISFSGYNDSHDHRPDVGYVNGVYTNDYKNNENWYNNWFENQKRMKSIADFYHAKFYCFAQPMLYLNEKLDRYDLLLTKDVRNAWNPDWNWRKKVMDTKGHPWFINLMNILDGHKDVFFDRSHITTEGNQIIAEHIYKHIKHDIR